MGHFILHHMHFVSEKVINFLGKPQKYHPIFCIKQFLFFINFTIKLSKILN